ncbi:MAG TPA: DUF3341 domain-containing protein [Phycisphaerae bacterium]|nr:DUF3341 domain-containing protein [Phycisphaerae bacterium]
MAEQVATLHGVAGEFDTPEALLSAAREAASEGYTRMEGYSPFVVEGLAEAVGYRRSPIAAITLIAGMLGAATGFGMCWYAFAVYYPLNIGGRPHNSWPAWIPITFELTVLFAALSAAIGMLALNGLPRLNHPVFEIPSFGRASRDRFFLVLEARDPKFSADGARAFLSARRAVAVWEVPA